MSELEQVLSYIATIVLGFLFGIIYTEVMDEESD